MVSSWSRPQEFCLCRENLVSYNITGARCDRRGAGTFVPCHGPFQVWLHLVPGVTTGATTPVPRHGLCEDPRRLRSTVHRRPSHTARWTYAELSNLHFLFTYLQWESRDLFRNLDPPPRNISGSRLKLETLNLVSCSQHICEVLPWDDELSPKWAWSGTPHTRPISKKLGHLNVSETAVTIYFKFCTLPVSVSTRVPPFGRADLENSEASRKSVLKLLPPQTHTKQYRER